MEEKEISNQEFIKAPCNVVYYIGPLHGRREEDETMLFSSAYLLLKMRKYVWGYEIYPGVYLRVYHRLDDYLCAEHWKFEGKGLDTLSVEKLKAVWTPEWPQKIKEINDFLRKHGANNMSDADMDIDLVLCNPSLDAAQVGSYFNMNTGFLGKFRCHFAYLDKAFPCIRGAFVIKK